MHFVLQKFYTVYLIIESMPNHSKTVFSVSNFMYTINRIHTDYTQILYRLNTDYITDFILTTTH